MIPDQHKKKAAAIGIALGLTASAEGLRQNAYRDIGGIPTICYGETKNVHMGQHETPEVCRQWLGDRLGEFYDQVMRCTKVDLPPARLAAFTDFSYNLGAGTYCKYIAPKVNAGKTEEACNDLTKFVKAAGVTLPGLVTRREKERVLCMEGL